MRSRFAALLAVLALIATACNDSGGGGTAEPKKGGSITVGAEQWPQCPNVVTQCASASWQMWSLTEHILPQAMLYDPKTGGYSASPLLTETPTTANGGVKTVAGGGMQITYKINPAAVWDDGTPITSKDFEFTRKALIFTKGSYYAVGSGFDVISKIDTTDPKTAVVTFKSIVAGWPDVFGGLTYVLKEAAFPNANKAKPDLSKDMQKTVPFSGGPWKLKSWSKNQSILVPNTAYWDKDRIPLLDQVTLVPRTDQDTEINGVLSGELDAIAPQPGNSSITKRVAAKPDVKTDAGAAAGGFYESLWLNTDKTFPAEGGKPNPLNDPKVREALFYAVDREEVNNGLIRLNVADSKVLNCGFNAAPGTIWCTKTFFDKFTYQPDKSLQILKDSGWDCSKVPQSACTKDGMTLNLLYRTTAGNARRETTQELVKEKIKATGFDFTFKNLDATDLFTNAAPRGDFQIADFAQGGTLNPSVTSNFSCGGVPTAANGYGGNNFNRWCDAPFEPKLKASDQELDEQKRLPLMEEIFQYEVDNFIFIPLYILPQMVVWNGAKLAGPIGEYTETPQGPLWNMFDWGLK